MTKRQTARKQTPPTGRPKLRLVPKRRPKRRWKLPRNLRGVRRPKYGSNPELLRYEEEIVMAVLHKHGGATLGEIQRAHPGRFRRVYLWRTLQRLRQQGKLTGWRSYSPTGGKPRQHERYRPRKGG